MPLQDPGFDSWTLLVSRFMAGFITLQHNDASPPPFNLHKVALGFFKSQRCNVIPQLPPLITSVFSSKLTNLLLAV